MKIATLCGMGFGTSLMLKMFVEEMLTKVGIKAEIQPWDLGSFKGGGKVDLIIAPKDMESHLRGTTKVILLQNVTSRAELEEKLMQAMKELGALPA